jgi:hypothetical protein
MSDHILLYLSFVENYGRPAHESRAIELLTTFRSQIQSDINVFLSRFPEHTRVGELVRAHLTERVD